MPDMKKLRSFSLLLYLVFIMLFIAPSLSYSQDMRLIMATEEWPPFRIMDASRPSGFRGIDIDIIEKLSESLGISIEIQHHTWARALEQIRNGRADMITGVAYNSEREGFLYFVPVSYCSVAPVFYTVKGNGRLIQSYSDLRGRSVGFSINSVYFDPFDSDTRIKKTGLSTEAQLLKVLALGRIDAIIGTDPNISYEVARLGYGDVLEPADYRPSQKTDLFIAISRKSPAMNKAKDLEQALRRMMEDGTIDKIMSSYR